MMMLHTAIENYAFVLVVDEKNFMLLQSQNFEDDTNAGGESQSCSFAWSLFATQTLWAAI